jgi:hypothetical protein
LLVGDVFDTNDDVILSKPWLPKFRNDYRIEPIAIGTKRFESDDISPVIELAKHEGIRIQLLMGFHRFYSNGIPFEIFRT